MALLESGEMYLETIYLLKQTKPNLHSVDVVEKLGYSKSSVSRAVNLLREQGYIQVSESGSLEFTEKGKERSFEIYSRHGLLTTLLVHLGVTNEIAEQDACRIEHVISTDSMNAIKLYLDKIQEN